MSKIKSANTKPERLVRSILHNMGYRFRIHTAKLPGKPDIVLPKHRIIIFVHGCFWHRHENCKFSYTPKSNIYFWLDKFKKTTERDKNAIAILQTMGWNVIIIWECELKDTSKIQDLLKTRLDEYISK